MGPGDATLEFGHAKGVIIVVHSDQRPSEHAWTAVVEAMMDVIRSDEIRGILVRTYGGAPNAVQRAQLTDREELKAMPTAVVTASKVAHGVCTVLRWFGQPIKAFPPTNVDLAMDYLGVPPTDRASLLTAVEAVETRLRSHLRRAQG